LEPTGENKKKLQTGKNLLIISSTSEGNEYEDKTYTHQRWKENPIKKKRLGGAKGEEGTVGTADFSKRGSFGPPRANK